MPLSPLRIAYVGQPGTPREAQFERFLADHFCSVTLFSLADLGQLEFAGLDVLLVDSEGDVGMAQLPARLTMDAFPLPTVLVGPIGGSVGGRLGLKLATPYGCICLQERAIVTAGATERAIFRGPFAVPARDPVIIDTPANFLRYSGVKDVPSTLSVLDIHAPHAASDPADVAMAVAARDTGDTGDTAKFMAFLGSRPSPGLVTTSAGFLDSPDCEFILGGLNAKAHDYVAVGRHGRFLQWGFNAAPAIITDVGKALLANAICYIAGFAHGACEALRLEQPREMLRVGLGLVDDEERAQWVADRFAEPVSVGKTTADALAWYEETRGFIRYVGGVQHGRYVIDTDLQALGVANDDPQLPSLLAESLDAEGLDGERSRVLWRRYLRRDPREAEAELEWLTRNAEHLFFSDWGGYRWNSRIDLRELKPPVHEPSRQGVVRGHAHASRRADGRVVAEVRLDVDAGYYVYAPGSSEGLGLSIAVAMGSRLRVGGSPVVQPADAHLTRAHVQLVLEGPGDELDLEVTTQACDAQQCLMPTTMPLHCVISAE